MEKDRQENPHERGAMFFLNDALRALRPSTALVNLHAARYRQQVRNDRLISEIFLDRTSSRRSPEEVAQFNANRQQIEEACRSHPALRAALDRLATAGVSFSVDGDSQYGGDFTILTLQATEAGLVALEALAANDAGYHDPAARGAAAERFRIYLLQHYHPDYVENRQRYPMVEQSPYG